MDLGITGRTALITGGDSGIGWHTARLLLEEGVTVVISDQDPDALATAAKRLAADEGTLFAFDADITSVDSLAQLHEKVQDAVGDIDILVQSAGVTGAQGLFHEITDEGWTKTIETDLIGPVRLVRQFLPSLRKGGWGRLVFLASEDAVQPYDDELPYCAAKAGILALSKGLSRSYASDGLLVNAVSPAFIHTPMTDAMMRKRADELGTTPAKAIRSFLAEERPHMELGRRGEPEEVASVIAFLCSDRASFVNGSNYRVDSGSVATI
ncbi:SDR family NAD(P)-dependent oxidoreductase [Microbacterium sp.]|uniref:SDR family NAD(P)-dependent oxidoreductase n=1 Tax=Microbacterium sp. TaxID=51671 RepID=UPI003F71192D